MSRAPRAETRKETGRKERVPMGVPRNKMFIEAPKGYVGRWMNDEDNRLYYAQEGGWEFVKDKSKVGEGVESSDTDLGQNTSMLVGTKEGGEPLRAYWMIIKKEWYEEDQRKKLQPVNEIDNAIKHGQFDGGSEDASNRYVPKSGIKYQN